MAVTLSMAAACAMEIARMNRLYAVEPAPSITGGRADHRFTLKASKRFPRSPLSLRPGLGVNGYSSIRAAPNPAWLGPLVKDLNAHRGASAVITGDWQPPEVHALVHQMNGALGNFGQTVR